MLVKQFYERFCQVIQEQLEKSPLIYVVEVFHKLHFLDVHHIEASSLKMNALLGQQSKSLYIDTEAG